MATTSRADKRAAAPAEGRPGLSFLWRGTVVLLLLLIPWPGLSALFASVAAAAANVVSDVLLSGPGGLRFSAPDDLPAWTMLLTLEAPTGLSQQAHWELRRAPYLPMAVLTALTVGCPFGRWPRRALVLGLGLTILFLIPALRLAALVGSPSPLQLVSLSPTTLTVIAIATRILVLPPGMAYAVPALLWLLLMALLDRPALERLLPSAALRPR